MLPQSKCTLRLLCSVCQSISTRGVASTFKASDLTVTKTTDPKPHPNPKKLVFGGHISDHMVEIDWSASDGWSKPCIRPVENLSIHPAAKCFHYAIELFEGMKAYRGYDDRIRLFRPMLNIQRMNRSAERSCLPTFDERELITCIRELVKLDQEWIPHSTKCSLYLRPTMIGTEATLGVSGTNQAKLFVLAGPVGPYFPTGFKPVSLFADSSFVRAFPGGVGAYKMGCNYAPTIYVAREAAKQNLQQVLWLYGPEHQITEVGTMNIFVYWKNRDKELELVTPPLGDGLILPGVTRRSLLDLAHKWGEFAVTERTITMREVLHALKEDRLYEMFGSGTACVVCPVELIEYEGTNYKIPTMDHGAPMSNRMYKALLDIQLGKVESDWVELME